MVFLAASKGNSVPDIPIGCRGVVHQRSSHILESWRDLFALRFALGLSALLVLGPWRTSALLLRLFGWENRLGHLLAMRAGNVLLGSLTIEVFCGRGRLWL